MARSLLEAIRKDKEDAISAVVSVFKPSEAAPAPILESTDIAIVDEKAVEVETIGLAEFGFGQIVGEIGMHSFSFPRLSIAQSVGEANMRNGWQPGSIILRKEVKIAAPKEEVFFTAMRIKTYYEEELPFDPNKPLRRFETLEELNQANLSVASGSARPVADIHLLLECPNASLQDQFSLTCNGKRCTLAIWTVRRTAYTRVAKTIITESGFYKRPLLSLRWKMSAQVEKLGKFMAAAPTLQVASQNTEAEIAALQLAIANPTV